LEKINIGLYLTIKTKEKCPNCQSKIDEWQSKDVTDLLGYQLETWQTINIKHIKKGEMHTICSKCKHVVNGKIKDGKFILEEHYLLS
jgi:hypothetical protein